MGRRRQDWNRRIAHRAWRRQDTRAKVKAAREDPLRGELWVGRRMPQKWARSASRGVKGGEQKVRSEGGNNITETEYIGQDGKDEEKYIRVDIYLSQSAEWLNARAVWGRR